MLRFSPGITLSVKALLGFALVVAGVLPCLAADALLSVNFQDETPGAPPSSAENNKPEVVSVAGGATTPSDPFGPEGNHSLILQKQGEDLTVIPRATWTFEDTGGGVLSFKGWTVENEELKTPLLCVLLFQDQLQSSSESSGPIFHFGGNTVFIREPDGEKNYPMRWRVGEENSVVVRFSPDKTYTLEINGEPIPDAAARFHFKGHPDTINRIQFTIADRRPFAAQSFVDDIVLKKE